jgi:hypothetical protein
MAPGGILPGDYTDSLSVHSLSFKLCLCSPSLLQSIHYPYYYLPLYTALLPSLPLLLYLLSLLPVQILCYPIFLVYLYLSAILHLPLYSIYLLYSFSTF